jgi:hypothetical protein
VAPALPARLWNCAVPLLTHASTQHNFALPRRPALRHRDLKASASEFSARFLSREVDYARSSTSVYARVLKEVHGAKADIAQLDAKHVGALGRQLSGARLVAARLAGLL